MASAELEYAAYYATNLRCLFGIFGGAFVLEACSCFAQCCAPMPQTLRLFEQFLSSHTHQASRRFCIGFSKILVVLFEMHKFAACVCAIAPSRGVQCCATSCHFLYLYHYSLQFLGGDACCCVDISRAYPCVVLHSIVGLSFIAVISGRRHAFLFRIS